VIRLDQDRLASGLNAMATQDDDVVTITVSTALAPVDRRAALRAALQAARRAGWISRRVPLFLLPFARGMPFARFVARVARVGGVIAGEPLVAEYDASHGTPQATSAAGVPEPSAPFRLRERRRPHRGVALLVALAALAALAGLVTYHLVTSGPAGGAAAARKPAAPAHGAARKHPAATSTPAPGAGSPDVVISLTAVTEPCWADLTTPGGTTIFQGIVYPGTSMTWTERRAITLRLANPGAVTLTVDGKTRTGLGPDPVTLSLAPGQKPSG
jgi:Domain of unknown function (DUF4115)